MFEFLKDHPFAVEAYFESSLVFTYASPKEELQRFIPECLELDTFKDRWAFLAVAMVQTKNLRPKGFPAFFGNDFFLIGYRVFVRFTDQRGRRLRGLYILKSETDKLKMEMLGNIFTHYKYSTTDVEIKSQRNLFEISSSKSQFHIAAEKVNNENVPLPEKSPFATWKEARRFAGPLPFTFTYKPAKQEVLIIEGVRQNWTPQPLIVHEHQFSFVDHLNLRNTSLASAFFISQVPYSWKKGKIEKWTNEDHSRVS